MAEVKVSSTGFTYGCLTNNGIVWDPEVPVVPGFVSTIAFYKKRGRDQGAPGPLAVYVTWVAGNPNASYPGIPPFGGPIVEETIIESWIQVAT